MNRRSFAAATLLALGAAGLPIPGSAQNYPDHAVKIIEALEARDTELAERLVREHSLDLAAHVEKHCDFLD